jgi:hypothetical protein
MRPWAPTPKLGKGAQSAEELTAQLEEILPSGRTGDEVIAWLRSAQIDFSDDGDVLRFTLKGPARGLFVGVTWVVTLRLAEQRLAGIDVDEGLTGP